MVVVVGGGGMVRAGRFYRMAKRCQRRFINKIGRRETWVLDQYRTIWGLHEVQDTGGSVFKLIEDATEHAFRTLLLLNDCCKEELSVGPFFLWGLAYLCTKKIY